MITRGKIQYSSVQTKRCNFCRSQPHEGGDAEEMQHVSVPVHQLQGGRTGSHWGPLLPPAPPAFSVVAHNIAHRARYSSRLDWLIPPPSRRLKSRRHQYRPICRTINSPTVATILCYDSHALPFTSSGLWIFSCRSLTLLSPLQVQVILFHSPGSPNCAVHFRLPTEEWGIVLTFVRS